MTEPIIEKFWLMVASRHDETAFATLDGAYREQQRGYHDWAHISDLLVKLDQCSSLATHPDLIATAIFWHDSVYVTRDVDGLLRADAENVRASAALFERHSRFDAVEAESVHAMIMATADHLAAGVEREFYEGFGRDHDLFLDLDLSSLAAPWPEFEANFERIRFEYGWVPESLFCMGRLQMLERFLAEGDSLFRRTETRAMWLAPALANLARADTEIRARLARPTSQA